MEEEEEEEASHRSFNRMEYRAEHSRQILTCVQRSACRYCGRVGIYPTRGISNGKREDTGCVQGEERRRKRTKGKRYRALPSEEGATCNDSI